MGTTTPFSSVERRVREGTKGEETDPARLPSAASRAIRPLRPGANVASAKRRAITETGRYTQSGGLHLPRQQQPATQISSQKAALGNSSGTTAPEWKSRGRMRALNIVRSSVAPSGVQSSCPRVNDMESVVDVVKGKPVEEAQFQLGIDTLNCMIEADARKSDVREWVMRFVPGKAEAQLSKEHLHPVWILVGGNFVIVIDLNGSSQHNNYRDVSVSHYGQFPPEGAIAFPMGDMLKSGKLQLPQSATELVTMSLSTSEDMRWGAPFGVLFMHPSDRQSIVRDICQSYLPSFLQKAYPTGIQIRGSWLTSPTPSEAGGSSVIEVPKEVREFISSSTASSSSLKVDTFTEDGHRLCTKESERNFEHFKRAPTCEDGGVEVPACYRAHSDRGPQQGRPETANGCERSAYLTPPWEGTESAPLFSGRLYTTQPPPPEGSSAACCQGVLILTARGRLELLVAPPAAVVTVADVKTSLLRSSIGRSLRLKPDAISLTYAPSSPILNDSHIVDTRYAVMRLKTCR